MWSVIKMVALFGVFTATLLRSAHDPVMAHGGLHFALWAATAAFATWMIGVHMRAELWDLVPRWGQKALSVAASVTLVTIFVASIANATAVANAPTEGPPCSAVSSPYAPLCSFSSEALRR